MKVAVPGVLVIIVFVCFFPFLFGRFCLFVCRVCLFWLSCNHSTLPPFKPGSSLSQAHNVLSLFVCGVSLCTMTAISVDWFLVLHHDHHKRYPSLMTEERAVYSSTTLWAISILLSCFDF